MTGAEAILRLEDLGARFALASDGTIRADLPDPEPAAMPLFLAELRSHRADAVEALRRREARSCTSCGTVLSVPTDALCGACYQARRAPGRVLPFDPGRRARTEARLEARRCPDCGGSWWMVRPSGDAECETCRRGRATAEVRP